MHYLNILLPNGRQIEAPATVWIAALLQSLGEAKLSEVCSLVENMVVSQTPIIGGGQNGQIIGRSIVSSNGRS